MDIDYKKFQNNNRIGICSDSSNLFLPTLAQSHTVNPFFFNFTANFLKTSAFSIPILLLHS
jgi:hypothetical protein